MIRTGLRCLVKFLHVKISNLSTTGANLLRHLSSCKTKSHSFQRESKAQECESRRNGSLN